MLIMKILGSVTWGVAGLAAVVVAGGATGRLGATLGVDDGRNELPWHFQQLLSTLRTSFPHLMHCLNDIIRLPSRKCDSSKGGFAHPCHIAVT
jgi:hypothetical protein